MTRQEDDEEQLAYIRAWTANREERDLKIYQVRQEGHPVRGLFKILALKWRYRRIRDEGI